MGTDGLVDERSAEDILRGRTDVVDEEDQALTGVIAALRQQATAVPRPDAELLRVFAEGLPEPEAAALSTDDRVAVAERGVWAERWRRTMRPVLARFAALGLMAKLALVGTTVAAAAVGGAGLAGYLPGQDDDVAPTDDAADPAPHPESGDPAGTDLPDEAGTDGDGAGAPADRDALDGEREPVPDLDADAILKGRASTLPGGRQAGSEDGASAVEDAADDTGDAVDDAVEQLDEGTDEVSDDAVDELTDPLDDVIDGSTGDGTGDGGDTTIDDEAVEQGVGDTVEGTEDAVDELEDELDGTTDGGVDGAEEDDGLLP